MASSSPSWVFFSLFCLLPHQVFLFFFDLNWAPLHHGPLSIIIPTYLILIVQFHPVNSHPAPLSSPFSCLCYVFPVSPVQQHCIYRTPHAVCSSVPGCLFICPHHRCLLGPPFQERPLPNHYTSHCSSLARRITHWQKGDVFCYSTSMWILYDCFVCVCGQEALWNATPMIGFKGWDSGEVLMWCL